MIIIKLISGCVSKVGAPLFNQKAVRYSRIALITVVGATPSIERTAIIVNILMSFCAPRPACRNLLQYRPVFLGKDDLVI